MATTSQESTQYANAYTTRPVVNNPPTDLTGKLRIAYFTHTQSGAGDATSDVAAVRLPPGRVRLLGLLSSIYVNWTTASATIDIGWAAYVDFAGDAVAADPNGLDDGVSVETAGAVPVGTVLVAANNSKVFESQGGVTILLTSQDEILADASTAKGYVIYVEE